MSAAHVATIDAAKVREFWEKRGERLGRLPLESIACLEERADVLALKTRCEQECILPLVPLHAGATILDLGAGPGQWTFRFAPHVARVVAVEYVDAFAEVGRKEARERGVRNVEFVTAPAQSFASDQRFDCIFISGLILYLSDAQAAELVANARRMLKPTGRVIVRDGTSVLARRHEIVDRYSEHLAANYSAVYRTAEEYCGLFAAAGFALVRDGQVFPEGSSLNKFAETRLRFYHFELSA